MAQGPNREIGKVRSNTESDFALISVKRKAVE